MTAASATSLPSTIIAWFNDSKSNKEDVSQTPKNTARTLVPKIEIPKMIDINEIKRLGLEGKDHILPDGTKFFGEIIFGKKQGPGLLTLKNGNVIFSVYLEDKKNGESFVFCTDGRRYQVMYVNDVFSHGQTYYPPTSRFKMYDGGFVDGKKHGLGKLIYKSGRVYDGLFVNGQKQGLGKETYTNGSKYTGQFKFNRRNGEGSIVFLNGVKIEGHFNDGKLIGTATIIFPDLSRTKGDAESCRKLAQKHFK